MIFKVIHFFRDSNDGLGWSEVWYCDAGNIDQAVSNASNVATTRARILSSDIILEWQRVVGNQPINKTPRPRQERAATLDRLDLQGSAGRGQAINSDLPWVAVKVRWAAGNVAIFRVQLLRGVPDSWFEGGSDKVAKANFQNWIPVMVRQLQLNTMRIRHVVGPKVVPDNRAFSFETLNNGTYEGYTRRATGRPFGLPRGRAPKRA
jgi:hypothetical protein